MKTLILAAAVLFTMTLPALADPAAKTPDELLGILPANLQAVVTAQNMTLVTSSYTVSNPAAAASVATITGAAGETLYLLASRCGGTVQGYFDVYLNGVRNYNSSFFANYGDSGYTYYPNWSALTVSGAQAIALKNPDQLTGTYSATILVGKVK